MSNPRLGPRNPLQLFEESENEIHDSRNQKTESRNQSHDSGIEKPESKGEETKGTTTDERPSSVNPESRNQLNENEERFFSLSVRIPDALNDALDDAVKTTRRNQGRKIRKEVMVAIAIESLMTQVESLGGWGQIDSEATLREILKNHYHP